MSRIMGGLGGIQGIFFPLGQNGFRITRPLYTTKMYIGAQGPQPKPTSPPLSSLKSLFEL